MSINTQRLYDAKALKFGAASSSTDFQTLFMESVYKTLVELQNFTGMAIIQPDDVSTDITIDAAYYSAVSAGIDYFLQDSNIFTANPVPDAEGRFLRAKKEAQRIYLDTQDLHIRFGTIDSNNIGLLQSEGFVT